jgi:hypothetical protein
MVFNQISKNKKKSGWLNNAAEEGDTNENDKSAKGWLIKQRLSKSKYDRTELLCFFYYFLFLIPFKI